MFGPSAALVGKWWESTPCAATATAAASELRRRSSEVRVASYIAIEA
jgi:hypothetical protein